MRADLEHKARTGPPPHIPFRWPVVAFVALGLVGALGYKSLSDSIGAARERFDYALNVQKDKLDAALAPNTEIESAVVRSASNDEFVQGAIVYAKDTIDDFESYNITFETPVFLDVVGKGAGSLLGVKLTLDDKLMSLFATHANGGRNHRVYDLYRNGIYFNFDKPVQVVQGLSFLYNASYSFHRLSCADVRQVLADVAGRFYEIQVQPFAGNARYVAENKRFAVSFAENSLYQCKDATAPSP